jgi:outer membrane protein
MRYKTFFFLLMPLLLLTGTGYGQQLTIDQAIEIALQNNFDIQIAKTDVSIADKNNSVGNAGMLPKVTGTVTDNYSITDVNQKQSSGNENTGKNARSNTLAAGIALNWTLFDGGRMFFAKSRLKTLEEISMLDLKERIQNSIAAVISAYYDIVRQQQNLKGFQETIKYNEERLKIAESKFTLGITSKVDMLQAKVDVNAIKAQLYRQQTDIEIAKSNLNNLLARKSEEAFEVSDSINFNPAPTLADIANKLIQTNPTIQAFKKRVEVANLLKKESFSQFFPVLNFNVGYNYSRNNNQVGFLLLNESKGLNVGGSLAIPLFNGLNTIRQYQVAKLETQKSSQIFNQTLYSINTALYNSYKDYTISQQVLELEEDNILLAKENVNIALERFKLSQSVSLELREAQKSYQDAIIRLVNARYDTKTAETELLRLSGELVK